MLLSWYETSCKDMKKNIYDKISPLVIIIYDLLTLVSNKVTIQRLGYSPNNVIKQNSGQQ